ncbi:unnamed protein product [Calypogeia fissa]
MLCKITTAFQINTIWSRLHHREGFFTIANLACSTPKHLSTSFLIASCRLANHLRLAPCGSVMDFMKIV